MVKHEISNNNSNVSTPGLTMTQTNSLPTNTPRFGGVYSVDSETASPKPVFPQRNLELQMVQSTSNGISVDTPDIEEV